MNPPTEINMMMEKLSAAWGSVLVDCDKGRCQVSPPNTSGLVFEAPTLVRALRDAVYAVEEGKA